MSVKITLIDKQADIDPVYSSQIAGVETLTPEVILSSPWSPVVYKSGERRRNSANFAYIQILALDIDNDPGSPYFSIEAAAKQFFHYKHIIATTASHQKPKGTKPAVDRFRVILYFETPINDANTYKNNWLYWVKLLGLEDIADPATKDAARFYKSSKSIVSSSDDGIILSVVETEQDNFSNLPHLNKGRSFAKLQNSYAQNTTFSGTKGKLSKDTMAFIAGLSGQDNWHASFVKAALNMKAQGYTEQEAETMLTKASPVLELDSTDLAQLADVYKNRTPYEQPKIDWPDMIKRGDRFIPSPTSFNNYKYLLNNILKMEVYYDCRRYVIVKDLQTGQEYSKADIAEFTVGAMVNNLPFSPHVISNVLLKAAKENTYDPLKNVFEGVVWDGTDRLEALFQTLKFKDDTPATAIESYRQMFKRWIRAMAQKYISPGSENAVLVFVGQQGLGKSRWLTKLASPWRLGYREGQVDPENKDHNLIHVEKFLWHIQEFDATTRKKDVGALKDFLTKGTISERRPYAPQAETGYSICSFCASVNSANFLHDSTGSRRFYVLPVEDIDAGHEIDMHQMYAQAFAEVKAGLPWYLTRSEIQQLEILNDSFKYKDSLEERLESCLESGNDRMTLSAIIEAISIPQDKTSYTNSKDFKIRILDLLSKRKIEKRNHANVTKFLVNKDALLKAKNEASQELDETVRESLDYKLKQTENPTFRRLQ